MEDDPMYEATTLPPAVEAELTDIADAAAQAAFGAIAARLAALGYPVTGDMFPSEVMAIEATTQSWVRAMARNNDRIAALQDDDGAGSDAYAGATLGGAGRATMPSAADAARTLASALRLDDQPRNDALTRLHRDHLERVALTEAVIAAAAALEVIAGVFDEARAGGRIGVDVQGATTAYNVTP